MKVSFQMNVVVHREETFCQLRMHDGTA